MSSAAKARVLARAKWAALAACTGALLTLALGAAASRARPHAERLASGLLGQPVAIERLDFSLLPLELRAHEVSVGAPWAWAAAASPSAAGPVPSSAFVGRLGLLRVRPHISSLLLLKPILARLDATGVAGRVRLAAGPEQASRAANEDAADAADAAIDPRGLRLPLDVQAGELQLEQLSVEWPMDGGVATLHVGPVEATVAPALLWRERAISLSARHLVFVPPRAAARAPSEPYPALEVAGALVLTGSLDEPEALRLSALTAHGPGVAGSAEGQAELFGPEAPVSASVHLALTRPPPSRQALPAASPVWLARLCDHAPWTPSELAAELTLAGSFAAPTLHGRASYVGPHRAPGQPLAHAHAEGRWQAHRLAVSAGRVALGERQRLAFAGELGTAPPYAVGLKATCDELPLGPLLEAVAPSFEVPLEATVTGQSDFSGTLGGEPNVLARLTWALQPARLLAAGERPPRALAHLARSRLVLEATLGPHAVRLRHARLELGDDVLHGAGSWLRAEPRQRGAERAGLHLQLWTDGVPLAAFSPIAGLAYAGRLTTAATVMGPRPAAWRVEATAEVEGLAIGPVHLGATRGSLGYADGELSLRDVVVRRGVGQAAGEATFALRPRTPSVAARLRLTAVEARDVLLDAGAPKALGRAISAPLWGQLTVHGPLDRLRGRGLLKTPRLTAFGLPLGQAELALSGRDGAEVLAAALWADAAEGSLTANVSLGEDHSVSARAVATDVPVPPGWQGVSEPLALGVRLALDGPLAALTGSLLAELRLARPSAARNGAPGGPVHLLARAHNGTAQLELSALQGALRGTGTLGLARAWPLSFDLGLHELPTDELAPWLPVLGRATHQVGVVASGALHVEGPLVRWQELDASLRLNKLEGHLSQAPIQLAAPATVRLAHGTLDVPEVAFVSRALSARLGGQVRLFAASHNYHLAGALEGEAAALSAWVPQLTAAKGRLKLHLSLEGEWQRPRLLGDAEWTGGAWRVLPGEQALEQLALKLVFTGRAVALTTGQARIGRGRLTLGGEWSLGDGSWLDPHGPLSLRGRLEQVPLRPLADASLRLTGNFELSGPPTALKCTGDFKVDAGRYTAKLDFDRLLRKKRAPPLKVAFLPFARPVALAVKLRAPSDLVVSSKVLEAELSADLLVTGTTDRVGLLGSVAPLWARARYRDNVFNIPRATVDFVDEWRIAPVYHIEVKTRACQMEASVLVTGDSEGYQLTPSGRDDRGVVDPQDVLSCLHLGVRLSDFSGHAAGYSDALTGSFDALWTVSGLDDKVRKFLPIRVDELRLTSGWSSINQRTTPRVVVGRELGRHVALRYSRAIANDEISDQSFSIDYKATPSKTLQAGYMSARDVPLGDFGLDLRLHWELP